MLYIFINIKSAHTLLALKVISFVVFCIIHFPNIVIICFTTIVSASVSFSSFLHYTVASHNDIILCRSLCALGSLQQILWVL